MARRLAILLATVALAFSACGGTPSGAQTAAPGATTGGGGGGTGTAGPNATAGGPAGRAVDPCAQLTVTEAAAVMDTDALTAKGTSGDPANCRYNLANGEEALVVDYVVGNASAQYDAFVSAGSTEEVAGVGDRARYEGGTRRLVMMAGGVFVSVFPRYVNGADDAQAAASAMGKIIAARLTTGSVPSGLQVTAPPLVSAKTACDLLSGAEAAGVVGKGPMEAKPNASTPQFCTYALSSSGEELLSVYLDAKGGRTAWDSFTGSLSTEPVSGLGDQALFESSTGILFVLKGDSVVNVNVYGLDSQQTLALDRRLMEIMLRHL
jgi:hypothetical protein